jgi:hypothetical protein
VSSAPSSLACLGERVGSTCTLSSPRRLLFFPPSFSSCHSLALVPCLVNELLFQLRSIYQCPVFRFLPACGNSHQRRHVMVHWHVYCTIQIGETKKKNMYSSWPESRRCLSRATRTRLTSSRVSTVAHFYEPWWNYPRPILSKEAGRKLRYGIIYIGLHRRVWRRHRMNSADRSRG